MSNYKFPQFIQIINNPTISVDLVKDYTIDKFCKVELQLVDALDNQVYGVEIDKFFYYDDTWEDSDILNFGLSQIEMYKIT